jgi:large subunit ribosomal protein L19
MSNPKIRSIEKDHIKKEVPQFDVGDTVKVHVAVKEFDKTRIQLFEGIVIAKKGGSLASSFTVRKVAFGEGVEKVFFVHRPTLEKVEVVKKGKAKRAKLYYLRKKVGKSTKIEEKIA